MKTPFLLLLLALSADAHATRRGSAPAHAQPAQLAPDKRPANEAFVSGDYQRAVLLYSALLASPRLTPADREAIYLNRGYSHLRLNLPSEAVADFRQAMALNPTGAEAATGLHALQNRSSNATPPSSSPTPSSVSVGWGPLARLAGRYWIVSTTKPVSYMRYEWGRVGVSMIFGGKDSVGNPLEGQYFIDPATNTIRVTSTYRGKTSVAAVDLSPTEFTTLAPDRKKGQRQVAQLQADGTFNIITQKPKGNGWETLSVATLVPATEQIVAALGWPDEPPPKRPSLMSSVLNSMKEGALEGLREGTSAGIHDAVRYRVRQITGTPECQNVSGEVVKCP
ncbi:MAG: hypothetical protein QOJ94_1609 [Sphingomonadales bacterium]|nr:hypothetical protein [Sphingomonadales bacterium]